MAVKKRATKKTTARKSTRKSAPTRRKTNNKKSSSSHLKKVCLLGLAFFAILIIAIGAIYYFGSFEIRGKIDKVAMQSMNSIRQPRWMPSPIAGVFDRLYDTIPSSEGFIVDGGELGRGDSPILAGMPQTRKALRVLQNKSYINFYDEKERQTVCVAFRLSNVKAEKATPSDGNLYEDPRVNSPKSSDLQLNKWGPTAFAPEKALSSTYGTAGRDEAQLITNYAPMSIDFADNIWTPLMDKITSSYPKRFDDIWIYTGPVYHKEQTKLASGIPLPDALYIIIFDLTESGGLRALALLIPVDAAEDSSFKQFLTSINEIEKQTGMRFVPEINFDAKDALSNGISSNLW
jgi:endonuclease G, mitochondrial